MASLKMSGVRLWSRKITGPVCSIDFSPRNHWAALGFEDGSVQLIDSDGNIHCERNIDSPIADIKILEGRKRFAALDEGGRLVCFNFSGSIHFEKRLGYKLLSFSVRSEGFFLWGWNTGALHVDSRGREKGRVLILRPLCELKSIRRKKQFFVIHDSLNLGLYRLDGSEVWRAKHPVPIDFSNRCADVDVSDYGRAVVITGFEKGVYIYNSQNCSLKNLELDKPITRAAVSRDGKILLLGDPFGSLYLASEDNQVFWEERLQGEVLHCRLDQKGQRALVFEKGGILSTFEFSDGTEETARFLELTSVNTIVDKKEIWKKTYFNTRGPFHGSVTLSGNGERILFNESKNYFLYDSEGNVVWRRSFMTRFDKAFLSNDGKIIFLTSDDNIFIMNLRSGKEKHLTYYSAKIKTFSFDPLEGNFLTVDKKQSIALYDCSGKRMWKSNFRKITGPAVLYGKRNVAVLRVSGKWLYIIKLKTLKVKKVAIDEANSKLYVGDSAIYAWGTSGKLFSFGLNGNARWTFNSKLKIRDVAVLKNKIIIRGRAGRVVALNQNGEILREGKTQNSKSLWNHFSKDLLEIVPEKKSVFCRNFLTGNILWKVNVDDEVKSLDVCGLSDRMGILGGDYIYYHYLVTKPSLVDGRSSFLEFQD